ncbi:unnamed protein product [Schistosoma curassoni]|uniref:Uncharacterized protein n=1 Tax=Schistosoma curassoni TaxID=6186 RepID=A0A183KI00_9TREM|nr:unnamed protein product [Schistosoma curassoni]
MPQSFFCESSFISILDENTRAYFVQNNQIW